MTNEEKIVQIMNYSKYGALSQIFVMQAIDNFCKTVIDQEEALLEEQKQNEADGKFLFINLTSWVGVAKEIKEKIK